MNRIRRLIEKENHKKYFLEKLRSEILLQKKEEMIITAFLSLCYFCMTEPVSFLWC